KYTNYLVRVLHACLPRTLRSRKKISKCIWTRLPNPLSRRYEIKGNLQLLPRHNNHRSLGLSDHLMIHIVIGVVVSGTSQENVQIVKTQLRLENANETMLARSYFLTDNLF